MTFLARIPESGCTIRKTVLHRILIRKYRTYQGWSVKGSASSWICKRLRILTNSKSTILSSVKVRRAFNNLSDLTACVCHNCKGQPPPV